MRIIKTLNVTSVTLVMTPKEAFVLKGICQNTSVPEQTTVTQAEKQLARELASHIDFYDSDRMKPIVIDLDEQEEL